MFATLVSPVRAIQSTVSNRSIAFSSSVHPALFHCCLGPKSTEHPNIICGMDCLPSSWQSICHRLAQFWLYHSRIDVAFQQGVRCWWVHSSPCKSLRAMDGAKSRCRVMCDKSNEKMVERGVEHSSKCVARSSALFFFSSVVGCATRFIFTVVVGF